MDDGTPALAVVVCPSVCHKSMFY